MIDQIYQPHNLESLLNLHLENPGAALMAGGTDLLVWQRAGRRTAGSLIMTEQVAEMRGIRVDQETLIIGAAAPIQEILDHPGLQEGWSLLRQALGRIGSPPIRHMATLGGNICSASPAGDSLPALYVMGAEVELASRAGIRRMGISELIAGPGRTAMEADECLVNICIPKAEDGLRCGFVKVGQRQSLAISVASLAYAFSADADQKLNKIALAWGSVGPTVMRFPDIEERCIGQRLERAWIEEAACQVYDRVQPIDDIRATALYRRMVAGRLLYHLLD